MNVSILFCFHQGYTEVYRNGLPLGTVRDGNFEVYCHIRPDGSKHPVEIPDEVMQQVLAAVMAIKQ